MDSQESNSKRLHVCSLAQGTQVQVQWPICFGPPKAKECSKMSSKIDLPMKTSDKWSCKIGINSSDTILAGGLNRGFNTLKCHIKHLQLVVYLYGDMLQEIVDNWEFIFIVGNITRKCNLPQIVNSYRVMCNETFNLKGITKITLVIKSKTSDFRSYSSLSSNVSVNEININARTAYNSMEDRVTEMSSQASSVNNSIEDRSPSSSTEIISDNSLEEKLLKSLLQEDIPKHKVCKISSFWKKKSEDQLIVPSILQIGQGWCGLDSQNSQAPFENEIPSTVLECKSSKNSRQL